MYPFTTEELGIIENLLTDAIDEAVQNGDHERTKMLGRISVKLTDYMRNEAEDLAKYLDF